MALAIPYPSYSGQLKIDGSSTENYNKESGKLLQKFCNFLKQNHTRFAFLDIARFEEEIKQGLFFLSNIPQGYGLGSSGALTAAVFDRYKTQKSTSLTVIDLRSRLASMESYFHGTSSGLDPLVSFTGQPVLIGQDGKVIQTTGNQWQNLLKKSNAFLADTKTVGKTEGFVDWFRNQMKDDGYALEVRNRYIPEVNKSINALIQGNSEEFLEAARMVSQMQLKLFRPMIPKSIQLLFEEGITNNDYLLKLCGSGGGGFMLGFSNSHKKQYWETNKFPADPIYLFVSKDDKSIFL